MSDRPEMQKHTLFLYRGDYAKLQAIFPENGAAVVVRKLIRDFLDRTEKGLDTPKIEVGVEL